MLIVIKTKIGAFRPLLLFGTSSHSSQCVGLTNHQLLFVKPICVFRPESKVLQTHIFIVKMRIVVCCQCKALSIVILLTNVATLYRFSMAALRESMRLPSCCMVPYRNSSSSSTSSLSPASQVSPASILFACTMSFWTKLM